MKINATFDREGYLENFATLGTVDGGMDVETPEDVSEDELMENYAAYRLENGALVLDEAKLAAMQAAAEQAALTARYIPSEAQSAAGARADGRAGRRCAHPRFGAVRAVDRWQVRGRRHPQFRRADVGMLPSARLRGVSGHQARLRCVVHVLAAPAREIAGDGKAVRACAGRARHVQNRGICGV